MNPNASLQPPNCPGRAYVGCRTTRERHARGRGIEVFDVEADGRWVHARTIEAGDNPSYLAIDRAGRCLHAVHGDGDAVSSFAISPDGALCPIGRRGTQGRNPVHLVFSPRARWVLVANYATGSVVSLPVQDDGSLGDVAHRLALPERMGPHRSQQRGPHPHQLVFDPSGRWLLVPDKGADAVHTLAFDERSGRLSLTASLEVAPGGGPRHMVLSPEGRHAWIVLELSSQVLGASFDRDSGRLAPFQRVPSVPEDFAGENTAAGIVYLAQQNLLFVSNRGHGSVVRFAVEPGRGALSAPSWIGTGGQVPRFIAGLPGASTLLAANEDADTIVALPGGDAQAQVQPIAQTGSPVCIAFTQGKP
ncbi:lactonase family protein [Variovorax sp. JS1663]|uniref:lactonase family protein n=1 Tax=Variovorax sp. JS1663 TaxID=1851577 RepID=UPI000B750BB2|nr:lactonase family protein [Variovorax sp. JS1663]OUM01071.1 hypothetical protein A8M77_18410 [Variovorax sp. JS1663]